MKADFSTLTHENCELYINMTKYLSEKHLRKSDYDRVCEDIFLMISDAQARNESAEQLFPNGMQEFCDEVAANCQRERWYITLINTLFCAFAVFSAVIFIEVIFTKLWANDGEWISGVNMRIDLIGLLGSFLASAVGMIISVLSSKFAFKKFIFNKKPGFYFYALLVIAVAIAMAIVLNFTVNGIFVTLNWVALSVGALSVAIAVLLVKFLLTKFSSKV